MLPKNILITWIQKLSYGWLVFCVGGVGSLTYFDAFAPGHEHGQHPFHLSIFEEVGHHHEAPLPQPEALTEQMRFWLTSRFNPQTDFLGAAQNLASGFTRFFGSGLSDGYILTAAHCKIFDLLLLFGSVVLAGLTGQSTWLAPPEKPPTSLS
jgi:hypothetical protein